MTEDRLGRIEVKLDKLSEAVVSLARMEERMVTLFKRMDSYDKGLKDLSTKVDEVETGLDTRLAVVEQKSVERSVIGGYTEKFFWIVIGAAVAVVVKVKSGVLL